MAQVKTALPYRMKTNRIFSPGQFSARQQVIARSWRKNAVRTVDYYAIDRLLTTEERDSRDAVRGWVEAECLPIIAGHYEKGTFPHHLIPRMARDILGGRGILADHHVMRHLCDLEALSTLEGTETVHALVMGKDLTGISAFE
jgi:hypothetical protein